MSIFSRICLYLIILCSITPTLNSQNFTVNKENSDYIINHAKSGLKLRIPGNFEDEEENSTDNSQVILFQNKQNSDRKILFFACDLEESGLTHDDSFTDEALFAKIFEENCLKSQNPTLKIVEELRFFRYEEETSIPMIRKILFCQDGFFFSLTFFQKNSAFTLITYNNYFRRIPYDDQFKELEYLDLLLDELAENIDFP